MKMSANGDQKNMNIRKSSIQLRLQHVPHLRQLNSPIVLQKCQQVTKFVPKYFKHYSHSWFPYPNSNSRIHPNIQTKFVQIGNQYQIPYSPIPKFIPHSLITKNIPNIPTEAKFPNTWTRQRSDQGVYWLNTQQVITSLRLAYLDELLNIPFPNFSQYYAYLIQLVFATQLQDFFHTTKKKVDINQFIVHSCYL